MKDFEQLLNDLKKTRDEIQLQMHLASMEAKEEWQELEHKWDKFTARADMEKSYEGVSDALSGLGEELKQAYVRFRSALSD
jgi:hypothetical protein